MNDEARGALLFAEAPTGILRLEPSGRVLVANPAASRVLGQSPERLRGRPFLEFVHRDDHRMAERQFGDVLRGMPRNWMLRLLRGDGAPRRREIHVSPVPAAQPGPVEELVVFFADSAEAGLSGDESRQLLAVLESLPGRFVLIVDGTGVIRHATGLSRTHLLCDMDVLGMPLEDLLDDDDSRQQARAMMSAVRSGRDWQGTQNHRRADDSAFPVQAVATPLHAPRTGAVQGVIIAARDITSQREMESRTRRAERLAELGQTVRGAVLAMSGQLGEVTRPDAAFVEREAALRRLERTVSGLREFSDPRMARPTYVELAPYLQDVCAERGVAQGLTLQVEAPASPNKVYADPEALRRALDLVLRNAEESMEGMQGRIHVQLRYEERGALVSVTDDGGGISGDMLARVFEPMETDKSGHVGLGLSVARSLLEQFGGRIWAEDTRGGGGRIVLELPWSAVPGSDSFSLGPLTLGAAQTVLVVDDDEALRRALRKVLERVGYTVKEAWSGRNAVATLMAGQLPDAVITDLRMLDGSGYWLLDQIRELHPALLGRTMIVTGDRHRSRALELGCPVLEKPVDLRSLLETLDRILPDPELAAAH